MDKRGSENTSTAMYGSAGYSTSIAFIDDSWDTALLVSEVLVILIIVATFWISLSMIAFGTRTRRWTRNRGVSSLNSGMIYTTCFVAITFNLTKLSMTLVYVHAPLTQSVSFPCELLLDIMSALYFVDLFLVYVVLWMVQRRIYTHPSVKTHVGSFMNAASKYSLLFLILAFIAISVVYGLMDNSEFQPSNGCMVNLSESARMERVYHSLACGVIGSFTQIIILILCIYPAIRARFPVTSHNGELVPHDKDTSVVETQKVNCCKLFCWKDIGASPIQLTVNRTVISSAVIVVTDVLFTMVESFMLSNVAPLVLHTVLYDINIFIDAIAMLHILGFATRILTLFCPSCPQSITASDSDRGTSFTNKISEV